eukprot:1831233-Prymnesium_polylepis.2
MGDVFSGATSHVVSFIGADTAQSALFIVYTGYGTDVLVDGAQTVRAMCAHSSPVHSDRGGIRWWQTPLPNPSWP